MSIYSNIRLDGDPARTISFGGGLLIEVCDQVMTPERAAAERAALEKERLEAEAALEAERQEAINDERFWAQRHGEDPPKRGPADVLREYDAATERQDRREQANQHVADCGCETCGSRLIGSGIIAEPRRLPSIVDKEIRAAEQAFMDQGASIGLVASMVGKVEAKLSRLLGKRRPLCAVCHRSRPHGRRGVSMAS